jgi:hypothetical protein
MSFIITYNIIMPNSLYFPALKSISPYYVLGDQLWRVATKTSNTYNTILTCEMAFQYKENFSTFNYLSDTSYMTLFHMGKDGSTQGIQICLKKTSTSSNDLMIGLRASDGTAWNEIAGSFYTIPNYKTEGTYFMFQYDLNSPNKIVNFYVVNLNATTKTTYDFSYTTTNFTTFNSPVGGQWGFGCSPEQTPSTGNQTSINEGYISSEGYNSYVAQNMLINYLRTWDTVVPVSSLNATTYAMFNFTASAYSLYNYMKTQTYAPYGITNLNFQMYVPTGSFVLANLANNAINPSHPVTLTSNSNNYPTLNP